MSTKDGILDMPVKQYWFQKIRNGEKTHEYRVVAKWKKRLGGENWKQYNLIRFRNGQRAYIDDEVNILYAKIKSVSVIGGRESDLKVACDVYDIEFKLIRKGRKNV